MSRQTKTPQRPKTPQPMSSESLIGDAMMRAAGYAIGTFIGLSLFGGIWNG